MFLKKLLCAAAASMMMLSVTAAAVSADDEEESKAVPLEVSDQALLTSVKEPALSFDSDKFDSYLHLTRDADKAGISFAQDKDTYYQGNSLKVKADTSGVEGYFPNSGIVKDADNNQLYPDAPEADETDKMSIIGIELHCEDFGLTTFDGCTFQYTYRLTEKDSSALLDGSAWVYAADADDVRVSSMPQQLKVSTTIDDNVSQYQSALLSVAPEIGSSKVIFELPTVGAVKEDVIYLDNITIILPESFGDEKFVKNVDGYNANAEAKATVDEIKISKKLDVEDATKSVEKTSNKTSPVVFVIIGVAVVAVAVAGVIIFKKLRNRFY